MKIAIILIIGLLISGCGDKNRESAMEYTEVAQTILIENSICQNSQDCTKKHLVFWEGAAPSKEEVHVNIYNLSSKDVALKVEAAFISKRKNVKHGVNLRVFSSVHSDPKVLLYKSTIR